jgi:hypothetical protein
VNPPVLGLGLNGVGQSIYVGPFAPDPDNTCEWKVWLGDCWDVNATPGGIVMGGFVPGSNPPVCCIRSFTYFQIGGPTNDICGDVFLDSNGNGAKDPGEGGVSGITVKLSGPSGPASVQTDANGHYCFLDVTPGDYTVMLDLTGSPLMPTTPTMAAVVANGCADGTAPDFGLKPPTANCDGHTPGFWSNKNGLKRINDNNIFPTMGALCLVDGSGNLFIPNNANQWKSWLLGGNAVNMAYMLSVQLAAMWCNVQSGFVSGDCMVDGGSLGNITINSLIAQAVASLCAHPLTLSGSPWRAEQEALKNALDKANNNINWL